MNSRPIPILGCLEEGKDEDDGQSGVGENDDIELGLASRRSEIEIQIQKTPSQILAVATHDVPVRSFT